MSERKYTPLNLWNLLLAVALWAVIGGIVWVCTS
jgi:hypothetical protein